MRSHGRTDEIERVVGAGTPISQRFVHGVGERAAAGFRGAHFGTEHAHAFDIDMLALDVDGSHEDDALHAHERTRGGGGHSVLAGTGLGYDAALAHVACNENLSNGIVDLVRAGVIEVFAFQIQPAAVALTQPASVIEWTRPTDIIAQQGVELLLERCAFDDGEILRLQFLQYVLQ